MSPTIVLNQDDEVEIVIGSPGGANIIPYVTKSVVAMVDWRLSPQDAIDTVWPRARRPSWIAVA